MLGGGDGEDGREDREMRGKEEWRYLDDGVFESGVWEDWGIHWLVDQNSNLKLAK